MMLKKTKKRGSVAPQHQQTALQEMKTLQDNWSLVRGSDGSLQAVETTTITASERRLKVNLFDYMGEKGLDVYSLVAGSEETGPRYIHLSYVRKLGFLGSKASLDAQEVNAKGIIHERHAADYLFGRIMLNLEPNQTIKIVSKDVQPIAPMGDAQRLAAIAFSAPQEYGSVYLVQHITDVERQAQELTRGMQECRHEFPRAICSIVTYPGISPAPAA